MPSTRELAAMKRYGAPSQKKAPAPVMVDPEQVDILIELARALLAVANREFPTPIVNVAAPIVNVPAPIVNIKPAEVTVRPEVRVESPRFDVHVPPIKMPTPTIRVDAPIVNVTNQNPAIQDIRIVSTPPVDVRRDTLGRIAGIDRRPD